MSDENLDGIVSSSSEAIVDISEKPRDRLAMIRSRMLWRGYFEDGRLQPRKAKGEDLTKRRTIILDLSGRVLGVYVLKQDPETQVYQPYYPAINDTLNERERSAAVHMIKAYKTLYGRSVREGKDPTMDEVRFYAATTAIPLEEIRSRLSEDLSAVKEEELAKTFNVPIELASYRVRTLGETDPDLYLKLYLRPEELEGYTAHEVAAPVAGLKEPESPPVLLIKGERKPPRKAPDPDDDGWGEDQLVVSGRPNTAA